MQLTTNVSFIIVVCLLQTYRVIVAATCSQFCASKGMCYIDAQLNKTSSTQSETCNCTNCAPPVLTCERCLNGGACLTLRPGQPQCGCNPGFTGKRCQDCTNLQCNNGGVCAYNGTKQSCQCADGYHGKNCEKSDCDNFCFNGGTCLLRPTGPINTQQPKCVCPLLYSGIRCETNLCLQDTPPANCSTINRCGCLNNGTCEIRSGNEVCQCTSVWGGEKCNIYLGHDNYCMGRCQNNGICMIKGPSHLPTCICNDGWTGEHCEKPADCQFYCQNSGVCSINNGLPYCHCNSNYKGTRCEKLEDSYLSESVAGGSAVLSALLAFGISILVVCTVGGIYYILRRRHTFFHVRLLENDFNNPIFQERDPEPFSLDGARGAATRLAYKD